MAPRRRSVLRHTRRWEVPRHGQHQQRPSGHVLPGPAAAAGAVAAAAVRPARAALRRPAERGPGAARPARPTTGRALRGSGVAWSYGELRAQAHRVAAVLVADLGLVPGNRVLLRGPNEPWLVACWLGVLLAGGVAVATMPMLRRAELAPDRRALPTQPGPVPPRLRRLSCRTCRPSYYADDADLTGRCAAREPLPRAVDTAADDVALLAFTSGTTGRPKATMHFHRDVLAIADTFGRHVLRTRPDDVFIGTPPIAFTFGLGGLVVFPLRAGASTVLLDRADAGTAGRRGRRARRHRAVHRAHRVPGDARGRQGGPAGRPAPRVSAGETLPGRGLARRARRHRRADHRRDRLDRDAARVHLRGRRRHPARARPAGRYPATGPPCSTTTAARCPTAPRASWPCRGPTGCRYLGGDRQQQLRAARLELHRRHLRPRRRRLLLVPGPQRRHDRLVRLQHLRAGGRARPARAPRRRWTAGWSARRTSCAGPVVTAYVVLRDGAPTRTPRPLQELRAARRSRRTSTRGWSSSSRAAPHQHRQAAALQAAAAARPGQ